MLFLFKLQIFSKEIGDDHRETLTPGDLIVNAFFNHFEADVLDLVF